MEIVKDFHGMNLEEAMREFHTIIGRFVREYVYLPVKDHNTYKLITGTGKIKDSFEKELQKLEIGYIIYSNNLGEIILV